MALLYDNDFPYDTDEWTYDGERIAFGKILSFSRELRDTVRLTLSVDDSLPQNRSIRELVYSCSIALDDRAVIERSLRDTVRIEAVI